MDILFENFLMSDDHFKQFAASYLNKIENPAAQSISDNHKGIEARVRFINEDFVETREPEAGSSAVIYLLGGMLTYYNWWYQSAEGFIQQLDALNINDNVAHIYLYMDGFGGQASAIPLILEFLERKQKPITSIIASAYSLHYWTACALSDPGKMFMANRITAGVGSVGVTTSVARFTEYFKKLGIEFIDIVPPESKDKNKAHRLLETDPKKAIKLIEEKLSPLAIAFQDAVKAARPNITEGNGELTGATFYTNEALKNGMADGVYTLRQAIALQDLEF